MDIISVLNKRAKNFPYCADVVRNVNFYTMNFWNNSESEIYIKLYDDFASSLKTRDELSFYQKFFHKKDKIIEFGCGSGRTLVPLLEKGFNISGLDISKEMLSHLKRKLKLKNLKTKIFNKNLINFSLTEKFDGGILSQRTLNFITLREGQKQALKNINQYLKKGAPLIINLMPARPNDFADIQKALKKTGSFVNSHTGNKVEFWENWIPNPLEQTWNFVNEFREKGDKIQTKMEMRAIFVPEMKNLLEICGFGTVKILGNWKEKPYDAKSKDLIFIASKS